MTSTSTPASATAQPAVTLAEIADIIRRFPPLELVDVPAGPYGDWQAWLSQASGHCTTHLRERVRLALFAGAHGCTQDSAEKARKTLEALSSDQDPSLQLLKTIDADLRVYELDLDDPTQDFQKGPALSGETAAHAMAYGMMAVEPGLDLLGFAGIDSGGEAAYAALSIALETTTSAEDSLALLARYGGIEAAAILGGLIAARLAHVPVLVAGPAALCAMKVLEKAGGVSAIGHSRAASDLEPNISTLPALALSLGRLKLISATPLES